MPGDPAPEGPASPAGPTRSSGGPSTGPSAPAPGHRRWRLLLAYDGAPFRGFAAQPGQPTVAGVVSEALARTLRLEEAPRLVCAGRTDAGVHARAQAVHADLPEPGPTGPAARPPEEVRQSLNRQLGPTVVVHRFEPAPEGFDARRSARSRRYRYLIWNAPRSDPLLAPVSWHLSGPLELRRMQTAADALLGEHDFRCFCRRPPGTSEDEPIVRRVLEARWSSDPGLEGTDAAAGGDGRLLRFEIEASSFCHQMVRSVVAMLAEAGAGRANSASVTAALQGGTRAGTPGPAPAWGLCLTGVAYPPGQAW